MAEDGYVYCPICQAVMPKQIELNQVPQFLRVLHHLQSHSNWSLLKHYFKEWWSSLRKGRIPRLSDDDALDNTLGKFTDKRKGTSS